MFHETFILQLCKNENLCSSGMPTIYPLEVYDISISYHQENKIGLQWTVDCKAYDYWYEYWPAYDPNTDVRFNLIEK